MIGHENRLITADCDSGKRRSNKDPVLSPKWALYAKTDWPTDFDFDFK
jgi:hypothetical protein